MLGNNRFFAFSFLQWLRKQMESRQASTNLQLDLSENDKDIEYLKNKAK